MKIFLYPHDAHVGRFEPVAQFGHHVGEWPLGPCPERLSQRRFRDFALFSALVALSEIESPIVAHVSCGGWIFPIRPGVFGLRIDGAPMHLVLTTPDDAHHGVHECIEVFRCTNVRPMVEGGDSKALARFVAETLGELRRESLASVAQKERELRRAFVIDGALAHLC